MGTIFFRKKLEVNRVVIGQSVPKNIAKLNNFKSSYLNTTSSITSGVSVHVSG